MWTLRSTKPNYGTAHADAPGQSRLDPEQHTECTSRHSAYGLRSQSRIPVFDSVHVLTPPKNTRMVRLTVSRAISCVVRLHLRRAKARRSGRARHARVRR